MDVQEARSRIHAMIAAHAALVQAGLETWLSARDPSGFAEAEEEIASLGRDLSDGMTAIIMQEIVGAPGFQAQTTMAARNDPVGTKLRSGGRRTVGVTLLGGNEVEVRVPYLKPDRRGRRPGRKRKPGRRGIGGAGLYPVLAVLGVWHGVTPAAAAEICRQVAGGDSVRSAREALGRRGLDLGHKQTLRIVNRVGTRLVEQRNAWLARVREGGPVGGGAVAGKRVVVAIDGGRLRVREPKVRGRRRKSGHRGFDAPWREPKLLTIYLIDDKGRLDHGFRPVIDGTMGDCDAVFDMVVGYLKALGVQEARALIVLGDGAEWIWNRIAVLTEATGIAPGKVREILDTYHAIEKIGEIAGIPKWHGKRKDAWLRQAKKLVRAGRIEDLVDHIRVLAVGRRAKKINAHVGYFETNRERMRYADFRRQGLPLGSGAIESAVRRVVNLRLKGNAKYWLEQNAEHMLLLRSYFKTGRFDDLFGWSSAEAVRWWDADAHPSPLEPIAREGRDATEALEIAA